MKSKGSGENSSDQATASEGRRQLLKAIGGGGVLASSAFIPTKWAKPVVESVVLPAHAQTTGCFIIAGSVRLNTGQIRDSSSFVIPTPMGMDPLFQVARLQVSDTCASLATQADAGNDNDSGLLRFALDSVAEEAHADGHLGGIECSASYRLNVYYSMGMSAMTGSMPSPAIMTGDLRYQCFDNDSAATNGDGLARFRFETLCKVSSMPGKTPMTVMLKGKGFEEGRITYRINATGATLTQHFTVFMTMSAM